MQNHHRRDGTRQPAGDRQPDGSAGDEHHAGQHVTGQPARFGICRYTE
jgi:hypothetical protein